MTDRLLARSLESLRILRADALGFEAAHAESLGTVAPSYRNSARNLLHYLSVRQRDLRPLQLDLHSLGLSSLGILEGHVLAAINAVISNLEVLAGEDPDPAPQPPATFQTGPILLHDHTRRLFGPAPPSRIVRIMVTMPSEAADDPQLIEDLLRAGMDVMRINCAHDGVEAWRRMASHLRRAERIVGKPCRIQADLAGPKLRTGPLQCIGHVLRLRPKFDALGRIVKPARGWFTPQESPEPGPDDAVAVPLARATGAWRRGKALMTEDLRGRRRTFRILATTDRSLLAEVDRGVYLAPGAVLEAQDAEGATGQLIVGGLPALQERIGLNVDDSLILTRDPIPGMPATVDPQSGRLSPAHIHCTLPAAFEHVRPGHRVWLDDGKIGGIVRNASDGTIEINVTHVPPGGGRLRDEKGINFPDSDLNLGALTEKDLIDLREVVGFVDLVALSFLRTADDVDRLQKELAALDAAHIGVVLKIENATAFRNLPRILLASLTSPPVGVMVARGDLAVEVGFERLSELQEEILWLCEAAHVPVIWATQVLEGLAKGGAPTRAEVSDAVMSSRAECVMLNKGPRVVETVAFLSDILERMAEHHDKRMALLRRLSVSEF
ncbi:MAG: pyruvate kinase [Steroidobacteraceae bacterium]